MTGKWEVDREFCKGNFSKTSTEADFEQYRKQDAARHISESLERTGPSSGVHFLRIFAGITSSPHVLLVSFLEMIANGVICISQCRDSVISGK